IPIVVSECDRFLRANGLSANGIFRVNGSERRISALTTVFDSPPSYGLGCSFEGYTVYDVADFLKKYLRGIPEPIFTTDLYPYFLKCLGALNVPLEGGLRLRAFRLLILSLPSSHLILLEILLQLFSEVASLSAQNQMNAHNLARIFSPNVLRPKTNKQPLDEYEKCSHVMEFFIDNSAQFIVTAP
ncbi:Rho GTPase activation protein, partial [Blyttiomyces helicus]